MSRILYKRYKTNVSVDSAWFSSCVKGHGSGGAANHEVVKGPSWFFVVYGPRGHRGPRVIGSGFSSIPLRG